MVAAAAEVFAAIFDCNRLGMAIADMIRMIATTINNSINEKPFCQRMGEAPRVFKAHRSVNFQGGGNREGPLHNLCAIRRPSCSGARSYKPRRLNSLEDGFECLRPTMTNSVKDRLFVVLAEETKRNATCVAFLLWLIPSPRYLPKKHLSAEGLRLLDGAKGCDRIASRGGDARRGYEGRWNDRRVDILRGSEYSIGERANVLVTASADRDR